MLHQIPVCTISTPILNLACNPRTRKNLTRNFCHFTLPTAAILTPLRCRVLSLHISDHRFSILHFYRLSASTPITSGIFTWHYWTPVGLMSTTLWHSKFPLRECVILVTLLCSPSLHYRSQNALSVRSSGIKKLGPNHLLDRGVESFTARGKWVQTSSRASWHCWVHCNKSPTWCNRHPQQHESHGQKALLLSEGYALSE